MPVDFQQIYAKVVQIGAGAMERRKLLDEKKHTARALLAALSE